MNIAIIDADLISRNNHRFPNLACMKLSAYYKSLGNNVTLITEYQKDSILSYDKICMSKVFTDTYVPEYILNLNNIEYGGTGFFFDKAQPLLYEIEHHMPDYTLYNNYIESQISKGDKVLNYKYYLDYSIGFTTRGCFRKCSFCVNQKYNKVEPHSPIEEFIDNSRKYICLLDDNILGYSNSSSIFKSLQQTNKRFEFKQGMDIRLLTEDKCKLLNESKYMGDYIFAFDNIEDKSIIADKLKLWRLHNNKTTKLYILCGFDRKHKYDSSFWKQDIIDTFERIAILMKYKCLPYIMRHENYNSSLYKGTYINLARWCNQPNFFKKLSYREYCIANQKTVRKECSSIKYLNVLEKDYPEIGQTYFDLKYELQTKW
jgi:hypothetical protein